MLEQFGMRIPLTLLLGLKAGPSSVDCLWKLGKARKRVPLRASRMHLHSMVLAQWDLCDNFRAAKWYFWVVLLNIYYSSQRI